MTVVLFIISLLIAAVGTIAGFGGGVFLVPILVMGFGVPISFAIGVSAVSLFGSSLISTFYNANDRKIDFKLMVILEVPTVMGAIVGAKLTSLVKVEQLEVVFALFLLFLSQKMLRSAGSSGPFSRLVQRLNEVPPLFDRGAYHVSIWACSVYGIFAGLIAGIFGIGGGILKTPIMIEALRVPIRTATATALCMIIFTSLGSGITHYQLGHVDLPLLYPCALGFALGAVLGRTIGSRVTDGTVKKVVGISIGLAGIATLIHTATP